MSGSRWRYYSYYCQFCDEKFEAMVDMKEDNIEEQVCPIDGHMGDRIPDFTIPKSEIQEKTHGGRISNGRLYQQHTGIKEAREQAKLNKQAYLARKKGDYDGAKEAAKELSKKKEESKLK